MLVPESPGSGAPAAEKNSHKRKSDAVSDDGSAHNAAKQSRKANVGSMASGSGDRTASGSGQQPNEQPNNVLASTLIQESALLHYSSQVRLQRLEAAERLIRSKERKIETIQANSDRKIANTRAEIEILQREAAKENAEAQNLRRAAQLKQEEARRARGLGDN